VIREQALTVLKFAESSLTVQIARASRSMRVFFDQGTPVPLSHALALHEVSTAFELGWSNLLREAEGRFEVFVTTDQNLRYQQNLGGRRLAILVLPTTNWPEIQRPQSEVVVAVNSMPPGDYRELRWCALESVSPNAKCANCSTPGASPNPGPAPSQ